MGYLPGLWYHHEPNTFEELIDLVSFIITRSKSGESEEHSAIYAAAVKVLRLLMSKKRSF